MKCLSLRMTRFRRRSCLIIILVLLLTFINLLLCTWKWQDNELELNTFELTFLRKRIIAHRQSFTKATWQSFSKANPGVLHHSKSGQTKTKRIHHRPVWDRQENHTSSLYQTMLRKEDGASVTKEYIQDIFRTGGVPVKKRITRKVRK